ncbi:hypothetical protein ATANTOWER_013133 [Ataeniobius toweri]|uniref:Uncharacterized protein n=1 Tax=Ataeniobius toweri TaxID=208326 RepID=A0ABU7AJK2_9TELE|nr:hypothetical protein [Ataeniobius toweri]
MFSSATIFEIPSTNTKKHQQPVMTMKEIKDKVDVQNRCTLTKIIQRDNEIWISTNTFLKRTEEKQRLILLISVWADGFTEEQNGVLQLVFVDTARQVTFDIFGFKF